MTKLCVVLSGEGKFKTWNTLNYKHSFEIFPSYECFYFIPPNWKNLLKGQFQSTNVDNKSSQDALPSFLVRCDIGILLGKLNLPLRNNGPTKKYFQRFIYP